MQKCRYIKEWWLSINALPYDPTNTHACTHIHVSKCHCQWNWATSVFMPVQLCIFNVALHNKTSELFISDCRSNWLNRKYERPCVRQCCPFNHTSWPPSDRTHCYSATRLMTSPQPWWWGNRSGASPLRCEDSIKHGVAPVVRAWCQHEHVLDDIEGESVVWQRTQELGLQEGCPFLLQNSFSSLVPLQHRRKAVSPVACRGRNATGVTAVCCCRNGLIWSERLVKYIKKIVCTIWLVTMVFW